MSTQPQPADDRLANVEALIDAAETRPLTTWEAEEVRSAPRAVRGNQRVGARREARMQRYLTAWRSARTRARHLRDENSMWRRTVTWTEQVRDRAMEDARTLHVERDALVARVRELEAALAAMTDLRDRALAKQDELRAERWPAHFGTPHASIGDAVGHAMAHNARLAAAVRNAQDGPQRPA
ncbi:hypothetical protein [Kitasatospora sp. NPDC047058]|uniref:hypothetical protein n=1 Tax=Kitasatospora sp. NPDC047058 TaxID=3155620 RepID=UPI0033D52DE7